MIQFDSGSSHVAAVPTTVKPAGLACVAELYLVSNAIKVASSGVIPFVSTGAPQVVSFPITVPVTEGTYPVYIDIYSDSMLIGAFVAIKDVVIAAPAPAEFEYTNVSCSKYHIPEQHPRCSCVDLRCTIRNTGGAPETRIVHLCMSAPFDDPSICYYDADYFELTLAPGESYYYSSKDRGADFGGCGPDRAYVWLADNKGGKSARCSYTPGY